MSIHKKIVPVALSALGLLLAPSVAPAVPLPAASTGRASEVVYNAASVSGTIVPGGGEGASDTRWCFEYGSGASPGYNLGSAPLSPGDAGVGTGVVPVSVRLTGLQPGSTYRYRLVAVNALGEGLGSTACGTEGGQDVLGEERLFTTPLTLPGPLAQTGIAGNVSQNAATISGTVDPQGYPVTYEFQVGVDTSYGVEIFGAAGQGTEAQPVSLTLQYLQPGTTYHYRLIASSQGGVSYGADQTFTTPVFATSVLSAPTAPPLIAIPEADFPSNTQAIAMTKAKTKKKAKVKKKAKKAKKESGTGRRRTRQSKRGM